MLNTGLVSVPFPPLLTGVWVGIIVSFKWAAIGEHLDNFSWGEIPNCVTKYIIYGTLNTIIFDEEEKCFLTLLKGLNVSRK